ncbi:3-hydroxybutyryl-CoA dehydrogenase [Tieghemostelium lacteum]|uniref:3-hydroxybutyryl-CoA dehydrogenase n=1 Tax=Tieghemostelium lacteum TaxID=361077 RepID=A0A151ZC41_TIELA|nr:3-hydroxybutyryl-CoA dehydrogenase [Tieghemostelium lacteum]|eukprot:KYQ91444.1 3-hydroxybutyryl-CoA dehydrogenase [Tieghemostelium lacteum]
MFNKQITSKVFNNFYRYYSSINKVGVIGGGQMGTGIAQVLSQTAGKNVVIFDSNKAMLDKSLTFISSQLKRQIEKGKIQEQEQFEILKRISFSDNMESLKDSDFVIEAIVENPEIKTQLFKQLNSVLKPTTILASNTSSISITKLASNYQVPENVIGMHFMNPVPVMQLVEVIPGLQTSSETNNITLELAKKMGKTTTMSKDMPGFIANRLLMPYINEAAQALFEGLGTIEDIDTTMKLGCNMPMGPLTLADFIGLDTCLSIMNVLHANLGDKYKPCPLLVRYVEAGRFGKKNGKGFYSYNK